MAKKIALKRYWTTNKPTVLVGERPAQDLNVRSATAPLMMNQPRLLRQRSQTDSVVPSS